MLADRLAAAVVLALRSVSVRGRWRTAVGLSTALVAGVPRLVVLARAPVVVSRCSLLGSSGLHGSVRHQCLLSGTRSSLAVHPTLVASTGSPRGGGTRFVLAAIAALVGLIFVLQGTGILPGSIMSGDPFWAFVGLALIAAALAYVALPRVRRR